MTFFTQEEFQEKYDINLPKQDTWKIEAVSEMILSQVGKRYRDHSWTSDTVPEPIKRASMEQLRFMYEYDIPLLDFKETIEAGAMKSHLKTDYSTLALRILANNGYLYRGNRTNANRGLNLPFRS